MFTDQELELLAQHEPDLLQKYLCSPYLHFNPRPDCDAEWDAELNVMSCPDQQTSFVNSTNENIDVVIAGNGSGKDFCSWFKIAKMLLTVPPYCDLAKFFVLNMTLEKAGESWQEKGQYFIAPEHIQHIEYHKRDKCLPRSIVLQPHENGNRYLLQFGSYDQDSKNFTGTSTTIGCWFNEYVSMRVLQEVIRGTRERAAIPGARWVTLTPAEGHAELEQIFNTQEIHPGYRFYHFNTRKNTALENTTWINSIPIDQRATRLYGFFSHPEGAIFKEFDKRHIIPPRKIGPNAKYYLGIDFGASVDHKTAASWIAREGDVFYIYDELLMQQLLIPEKIRRIKEKHPEFKYDDRDFAVYCDPEALQERKEFIQAGLHNQIMKKEPVLGSIELVRKLFLEDKLFIFNNCTHTINQLHAYSWKKGKQEPEKKNDDLVDAAKGVLFSTASVGIVQTVETAKPKLESVFGWGNSGGHPMGIGHLRSR